MKTIIILLVILFLLLCVASMIAAAIDEKGKICCRLMLSTLAILVLIQILARV